MQTPNVVHPNKINVEGILFEVVSYASLTDQQALTVVRQYLRGGGLKKKDKGKTIRIFTRIVTVLGLPPVDSPLAAVRVSITGAKS